MQRQEGERHQDINPEMLEIARQRVREVGVVPHVELEEMGVAELEREAPESHDAVMSGLCFSELSEDELRYTLGQVRRVLRPGGLLTHLLTQQTTHAVGNLPRELASAGLTITFDRSSAMGGFMEVVAVKPRQAGR